MSPAGRAHAVVASSWLDLRTEPAHRAELASQLLVGELVVPLGRVREGWQRVENEADGYRGWARTWGLVPTDAAGAQRWRARARVRVCALSTQATARPGAGLAVGPLPWGGRVIGGRTHGGHRLVEWPDGRRGWVPAEAVRPLRSRRRALLERAFQLLGVPYLWGGRTPAGLDCSALVQLLLAEQGVTLPRDARDQHQVCRELRGGEEPRVGDLAFFARPREAVSHVGLWVGPDTYIHARGWVRVASVEPGNPLCDKELVPQFRGWFRPPGGR